MKIGCFTGHRPVKFSFKYNEKHPDCVRLKGLLKEEVRKSILEGYDYWVSGMALAWDTWGAEIVLELKAEFPHIKLEAALPCFDQEKIWPEESQKRYHNILAKADWVRYVTKEPYSAKTMLIRDFYMVDKSGRIIAGFNGTPGGTKHTHDYAVKKGLEIIRINPVDFSVTRTIPERRLLECSSKGDKRFSAFYAKVKLFDKKASIEHFYQLAKRFGDEAPLDIKEAKGRMPSHISICGEDYSAELLTPWYKYLWLIYLDELFASESGLLECIRGYDGFTDMFKGKNTINCQADVVEQYVRNRDSLVKDCAVIAEIVQAKKPFTLLDM